MSCNFRSVSRQPFKLRYFIYNFFFRLFGLVREAANTLKEDFGAARKFKDYRFQDICLASGTKWATNGDGTWHIFKANETKTQIVVSEFLDHFGIKNLLFARYKRVEETETVIKNLSSLVDLGFPLHVEKLKKACQRKSDDE